MKLIRKISKSISFCSIFCLVLVIPLLGFTNQNGNQTNEYLLIYVEYDAHYQLLYIQEQSKDIKKLAVAINNNWPTVEKKLIDSGFEISKEKVKSRFDNSFIFNLINKYEELGWKLHSHSMGIGDEYSYEKGRAVQYLLHKQKN